MNSEQRDVSPAVKMGTRSHMMIPDTQVKPGVPTRHLEWIGEYIVDRKVDVVVHIGDHWDMPSLSSYDKKGGRKMEGRRYVKDVEAGNRALELVRAPARRAKARTKFHLLRGNHENRIKVALDDDARLEGTIGFEDLESPGWEVHDYLDPVFLDGVGYSHYWYNPMSGNPWCGTIENRLQKIGHSFTMGHQQVLLHGIRYVKGVAQHGLVAGACYLHDEDYKGPQGNAHWRGVVVKHEVEDGAYDPMFVSLGFLCRKYEGCSLEDFLKKGGK
jgi:hypothetical protein